MVLFVKKWEDIYIEEIKNKLNKKQKEKRKVEVTTQALQKKKVNTPPPRPSPLKGEGEKLSIPSGYIIYNSFGLSSYF